MNDETKNLFEDIIEWMIENDYECGERGSQILAEIHDLLDKYEIEE